MKGAFDPLWTPIEGRVENVFESSLEYFRGTAI